MLQRVPLRLALSDDLTLRGLTVLVQNPQHFAMNFDNRCWRDDPLEPSARRGRTIADLLINLRVVAERVTDVP
jgi:hypothetical protein